MTSCSVRTCRTNSLVSAEIGFCIAVEFDTAAVELLAVVDGFLPAFAGEAVECPE